MGIREIAATALSITLLLVNASLQAGPADSRWPRLHTRSGETIPASHALSFPLKLETSSLAWDSTDKTFYTTIDKGEPHIVQFRLAGDSLQIVRSGTIPNMDANYDFEGIDIAFRSDGPDLLYISTERRWKNDSLRIWVIDKQSWQIDSAASFSILPEGTAVNNNLEGLALGFGNMLIFLGKERQPAWLGVHDMMNLQATYGLLAESAFVSWLDSLAHIRATSTGRALASVAPQIAISGLAFQLPHFGLYVLNRYGRSIIRCERVNACADVITFSPMSLLTYTGIDYDDFTQPGISDKDKYGLAEGIALCVVDEVPSIAILTDPGPGAYPYFVLFPDPWRK